MIFFLAHARRKFDKFCRISRSRNDYLCERFSPLTRAATVVDLLEAPHVGREGTRGQHPPARLSGLCASNDPRTEAQRSASTAKATRRRSRSAFLLRDGPGDVRDSAVHRPGPLAASEAAHRPPAECGWVLFQWRRAVMIQARELNQTPSPLMCAASASRRRWTACVAAAGSSLFRTSWVHVKPRIQSRAAATSGP